MPTERRRDRHQYRSHLALSELPWFEVSDGRLRLADRSIGPVADVVQYDVIVEELESIGITDPYLITE